MLEQYYPILQKCGMFNGIVPRRYEEALQCLNARVRQLPKGTHITEQGQKTQNTGIVLSGSLSEYLYDEGGNQINICRLTEGQAFGAELSCTGWSTSPVSLRAENDGSVLLLDFGALLSQQTMTCPCRMQVTANLMQEMAKQLLFFNTKIRILAQKRLRDRLKIYLQTLPMDEKGNVSVPYSRTELAEFLCVDRSALSRELCRMRDEGILTFSGSRLRILDSDFLK